MKYLHKCENNFQKVGRQIQNANCEVQGLSALDGFEQIFYIMKQKMLFNLSIENQLFQYRCRY